MLDIQNKYINNEDYHLECIYCIMINGFNYLKVAIFAHRKIILEMTEYLCFLSSNLRRFQFILYNIRDANHFFCRFFISFKTI